MKIWRKKLPGTGQALLWDTAWYVPEKTVRLGTESEANEWEQRKSPKRGPKHIQMAMRNPQV